VYCTVLIRCNLCAKYQVFVIPPSARRMKMTLWEKRVWNLKNDSSTTILRLKSYERPETQTFTLDLVGIRTSSKSQTTKAARQTRAINAWPSRYFYLSMLVFTSLVASWKLLFIDSGVFWKLRSSVSGKSQFSTRYCSTLMRQHL